MTIEKSTIDLENYPMLTSEDLSKKAFDLNNKTFVAFLFFISCVVAAILWFLLVLAGVSTIIDSEVSFFGSMSIILQLVSLLVLIFGAKKALANLDRCTMAEQKINKADLNQCLFIARSAFSNNHVRAYLDRVSKTGRDYLTVHEYLLIRSYMDGKDLVDINMFSPKAILDSFSSIID